MADKEERILITKCSGWCHARRMSCDPFDDKDGMYCDKSGKWRRITEKDCAKCKDPVLLGVSRQEAIERIAKAIEYNLNGSSFRSLAQAALDALLGETK
mgnify:CR=1 FL=1